MWSDNQSPLDIWGHVLMEQAEIETSTLSKKELRENRPEHKQLQTSKQTNSNY